MSEAEKRARQLAIEHAQGVAETEAANTRAEDLGTKDNPYYIIFPKPLDLLVYPKDEIHITRRDLAVAFDHKEKGTMTARDEAMIRAYLKRRRYAFQQKHSPSPKYTKSLISVITALDDIEDVISSAAWATFAAGAAVPEALPALWSTSRVLNLATIPINMVEAGIGAAINPVMCKAMIEDLCRVRRNMRKMKGKIKKEFNDAIVERAIAKEMRRIPVRKRLRAAIPSFGTALEMGQASGTITGYGIILGPLMGAFTDLFWGAIEGIKGKSMKIVWPWQDVPEELLIAGQGAKTASKVIAKRPFEDPETDMKAQMALTYAMSAMNQYLDGKDYDRLWDAVMEYDEKPPTTISAATQFALEDEGIDPDPTNEINWFTTDVEEDGEVISYPTKDLIETMQAILLTSPENTRKIAKEHDGYLSGAMVNLLQDMYGEGSAAFICGGRDKISVSLDSRILIAAYMAACNIFPYTGKDYGCGYPGFAFGHTVHYPRHQALDDLLTTVKIGGGNVISVKRSGPGTRPHEALERWVKFHGRYPQGYLDWKHRDLPYLSPESVDRPDQFYSWRFDLYEYWMEHLNKLARLYDKGEIRLHPSDFFKHINEPRPALYDWKTGTYANKQMSWVPFPMGDIILPEGSSGAGMSYERARFYAWQGRLADKVIVFDDFPLPLKWEKLYDNGNYSGWVRATPGDIPWLPQLTHSFLAYYSIIARVIPKEEDENVIQDIYNITPIVYRSIFGAYASPVMVNGDKVNWYRGKNYWNPELVPTFLVQTYQVLPIEIIPPSEYDVFKDYLWAPPTWWHFPSFRKIFHKYMLTRDPDYPFPPLQMTLNGLKRMYQQMESEILRIQDLPKWPEKLEQMLRDKGLDGPGWSKTGKSILPIKIKDTSPGFVYSTELQYTGIPKEPPSLPEDSEELAYRGPTAAETSRGVTQESVPELKGIKAPSLWWTAITGGKLDIEESYQPPENYQMDNMIGTSPISIKRVAVKHIGPTTPTATEKEAEGFAGKILGK